MGAMHNYFDVRTLEHTCVYYLVVPINIASMFSNAKVVFFKVDSLLQRAHLNLK